MRTTVRYTHLVLEPLDFITRQAALVQHSFCYSQIVVCCVDRLKPQPISELELIIQRLHPLLFLLAHDAVKEEHKYERSDIPSVATRGIFSMSAFSSADFQ